MAKIKEKIIDWRGSSLADLKDDKIFTENARKEAGYQLSNIQAGLEPDNWKPIENVGQGVKEITVDIDDGWFRVMYVAKFPEAIYVLHSFKKKTNKTAKHDIDIAETRYRNVVSERKRKQK